MNALIGLMVVIVGVLATFNVTKSRTLGYNDQALVLALLGVMAVMVSTVTVIVMELSF
jgi:hypothetical protein